MNGSRALAVIAALACLAVGVALGVSFRGRFEPVADAALPHPPASPPSALLPGPDFATIARRATPAVVNISAEQVVRAGGSPFLSDPFFREFFGRDPFGMREERKTSLGSGVIVSADGLVVTNNHVVEHAQRIAVTTADKRRHKVTLVGTDPATDVAVLRIDGNALPFLPWGDSSAANVGEYVLAIGNPFQLNQTVTMGIISALGRSNVGIVDYEDFIQTDAAINPGNSGGALVDTRAQLIGINTAIYSETGGYQGIGFAVPANLARRVVDQLVTKGRVVRGWVGITQIARVSGETARALGVRESRGAVIVELVRGSPADRAGIEPGDVVVAVGGRSIEEPAELRNVLAQLEVGRSLELTILRDGRRHIIRIPVEEARPNA